MKLTPHKIPGEFIQAIPRGFRLLKKQGHDFLLIESLFCPNGHNLVVDSVRIHDEASVKLKLVVNHESGFVFIDAFWGSHAKLFSFIPQASGHKPLFAEAFCPYCDVSLMEHYACGEKGCGSDKSLVLIFPGGKNKVHVCARLGCPGHVLDISDMPHELVQTVNAINYFGAGPDNLFGGI